MKRFLTLLLAVLMLASTFSMFGCADKTTSGKVLRVCNCEDYIDEDLLTNLPKKRV